LNNTPGFKPFVEACIEEGATEEALKYVIKLSDPHERAEVGILHTGTGHHDVHTLLTIESPVACQRPLPTHM
jgi:hypothetical protein